MKRNPKMTMGDLCATKPVRVALAVPSLVMKPNCFARPGERRVLLEDPGAQHGMAADELPLLGAQGTLVANDRVREREHPDVAQTGRHLQVRSGPGVESQPRTDGGDKATHDA